MIYKNKNSRLLLVSCVVFTGINNFSYGNPVPSQRELFQEPDLDHRE